MDQEELKLAADFPPVSYNEWRELVENRDLKGVPFEKKMVTKTPEGIDIQPLYVAEDWPSEGDPSGVPGFFPYTRGTDAISRAQHGWDIRQEFRESDPKVANAAIQEDLSRGVNSIVVRLDDAAQTGQGPDSDSVGVHGVMIHDVSALNTVLTNIDIAKIPVELEPGLAYLPAAMALIKVWEDKGVKPADAKGSFGADPIAALAKDGTLPFSAETALSLMAKLADKTAKTFPNVHAVTVNTSVYHNAGASEVQDLGIALATATAYLRAMTDAGMDIDSACKQIAFTTSVDCQEYKQISKLRAARKLWAAVAKSCGASIDACAMILRAKAAKRMMTKFDPWVNLLRTTVSTFASAVGGANSVTCLPFDDAIGLPDEMGRRISRNTQIMLMEESHLFRVIDPAGGTWSMETLTTQIAEKSWAFFQEIEAKGGIVAALQSGFIQDTIAATMADRDKSIAKRKTPITGVSEFPNITEDMVVRPPLDVTATKAQAIAQTKAGEKASADTLASLATSADPIAATAATINVGASFAAVIKALSGTPITVSKLPIRHLADSFERLRYASNAYKDKTGNFPSIFLANLGPIASHTGRATFAKNYFEAGGIMAPGNNGFPDVAACVAGFKESGAKIAVICSSDKNYVDMVPEYAPALKAAGVESLYLAGHPGDKKADYDAAGIDGYIYMGAEVLGPLTEQLIRLGVMDQ